jgi:hypothetical protein
MQSPHSGLCQHCDVPHSDDIKWSLTQTFCAFVGPFRFAHRKKKSGVCLSPLTQKIKNRRTALRRRSCVVDWPAKTQVLGWEFIRRGSLGCTVRTASERKARLYFVRDIRLYPLTEIVRDNIHRPVYVRRSSNDITHVQFKTECRDTPNLASWHFIQYEQRGLMHPSLRYAWHLVNRLLNSLRHYQSFSDQQMHYLLTI